MARIYPETCTPRASTQSDCLTDNLLYGQDIISMQDLSLAQVQQVMAMAAALKAQRAPQLLNDKVIAHCFFEPSTRTRLSFESATLRLGGRVIGFSSDESLSIQKGETLHDTIRVISHYADLLILRHPKEGAARYAADLSQVPVINAGDGANQHPTQALVDLFSIQECQQRLDGLAIALVGDLKYGRTTHSLVQACRLFDMRLFLVSPESLALPHGLCDMLKKSGVRFSFHQSIEEVIPKVDILYMTRIQQERFSQAGFQLIKQQFVLKPSMLSAARPNLKVFHPLPRVNEIEEGVDQTPHAYYFEQAANGVFVRQALLTLLLNKALP